MVSSNDRSVSRLLGGNGLALMCTTLGLALIFACQTPGKSALPKSVEPFKPALSVRPVAVSLGPGATQTFQAEMNVEKGVHYQKSPVGWRVMEPGGGMVDGAGIYTAPPTPGIYHVQVRREDFKEITAMATVTVK
jgi:hypothetical protein